MDQTLKGVVVTGWFNLVHVLNPGAAFSFLADAGGWQRWFFIVLGTVVSLVLALVLRRGMHGPAFNFADILVVGSAGLLMLASFGTGKPHAHCTRDGDAA